MKKSKYIKKLIKERKFSTEFILSLALLQIEILETENRIISETKIKGVLFKT